MRNFTNQIKLISAKIVIAKSRFLLTKYHQSPAIHRILPFHRFSTWSKSSHVVCSLEFFQVIYTALHQGFNFFSDTSTSFYIIPYYVSSLFKWPIIRTFLLFIFSYATQSIKVIFGFFIIVSSWRKSIF